MESGIINIYKKAGFTSHDVVAKARGILREKKIGHTGTLDPEAEGVLPICIGKATKIVPYLMEDDKCYEAEVILGSTTTTEDSTGEVVATFPVNVTREQIAEVVASFVGDYTQTPPMYSAIKVNGTRLYELARQGIVVDRPSRTVKIYSADIIEYIDNMRFRIRVKCSKGTYIRTLCTDIGEKLGCGAHMGYLLRTQVGRFNLENSVTLDELQENKEEAAKYLYSLEEMFDGYKKVKVIGDGKKLLANGNPLKKAHLTALDNSNNDIENDEIVAVYDENKFVALYKYTNNRFMPEKMF